MNSLIIKITIIVVIALVILYTVKPDLISIKKYFYLENLEKNTEKLEELENLEHSTKTIGGIFKYGKNGIILTNFYDKDEKSVQKILDISKIQFSEPVTEGIENKIADTDLYYDFTSYTWKIDDDWLIKDIINNTYYVPSDILKINKGTIFSWSRKSR